jgi:hypothetical protein
MMTDDELKRRICSGTTAEPEDLTVLCSDGKKALVKCRGKSGRNHASGREWLSAYVKLYDLAKPKFILGILVGKQV